MPNISILASERSRRVRGRIINKKKEDKDARVCIFCKKGPNDGKGPVLRRKINKPRDDATFRLLHESCIEKYKKEMSQIQKPTVKQNDPNSNGHTRFPKSAVGRSKKGKTEPSTLEKIYSLDPENVIAIFLYAQTDGGFHSPLRRDEMGSLLLKMSEVGNKDFFVKMSEKARVPGGSQYFKDFEGDFRSASMGERMRMARDKIKSVFVENIGDLFDEIDGFFKHYIAEAYRLEMIS